MSYYFTGFFASHGQKPEQLPEGAVWREIEAPFVGVGVRLPELDGAPLPSGSEVKTLLRTVGLEEAKRWIYLCYVCWGGSIDFVYGLGARDGEPFGPSEESEIGKTTTAFVDLMKRFGVTLPDSGFFEPFEYGYWGEKNRSIQDSN